jgi:hypothetical protein
MRPIASLPLLRSVAARHCMMRHQEMRMRASPQAGLDKSSKASRPSWLARAGRKAFQLLLAGISARAQAVSGSGMIKGR